IAIAVGPAIALDRRAIEDVARRLAPATRHLGLEKVVVRLRLGDRVRDPVDLVVSDLTGSGMEIAIRPPETAPLGPATSYERKVVEARRRRLVYPYEVTRMLTGRNGTGVGGALGEYGLDPQRCAPRAVRVPDSADADDAPAAVVGVA